MGNRGSTIEHYNWSSDEFPKEFALIYRKDKSKYSIFRLSINPERVLLRLSDTLCDDHGARLFHMEVTAVKDNNGSFNLGLVKVVADGITPELQTVRDGTEHNCSHLCGRKSCFFGVTRKGGSIGSAEKMTCWEVLHSFNVSLTNHIRYYVNIECDNMTGLTAKLRGPFQCEGQISREGLLKESAGSLIQFEVIEEPPKAAINAFVESKFTGKEYILFQQQGDARVNIFNSGSFHGHGNGSQYKNCNIVMNCEAGKGTN